MNFSQDNIPAEPGLYLYTLVEGSHRHECRVWKNDSGTMVAICADGAVQPVKRFARWWADEFLSFVPSSTHPRKT